MIRITFDLLPGGNEKRSTTIGVMEIANIATRLDNTADYAVVLKKTPPFPGALQAAWRKGHLSCDDRVVNGIVAGEDEESIRGLVEGHHRTQRGIYDLFYRALVACGLHLRAPSP